MEGALTKFLKDNDTEGFGCACTPERKCGPCSWDARFAILRTALAPSVQTSSGGEK